MGGGWVGYIYVFFGCGVLFALVAGSTLLLYAWARVAGRRGAKSTVRVTSLPNRQNGSDAPSAG